MDNQFGKCCSCPAQMSDARHTTTYAPRRVYNSNMMDILGVCNSNAYRSVLTKQGVSIIDSYNKALHNKMLCKNNEGNVFYERPDINALFDANLVKNINEPDQLQIPFMLKDKAQ